MNQENNIQLYKDREFSEIISVGFKFIKLNIKPIIRYIAFYALPFYLLGTAFFGLFFINYLKLIQSSTNIFADIRTDNGGYEFAQTLLRLLFSNGLLYYFVLGIVLFFLGYLSFTFVIGKFLDSHSKNQDFNAEPYWPAFFKFFLKYLILFFIYIIALIIIFSVIFLLVYSISKTISILMILLSSLLFLVGFIYFLPTLAILSQVLISEPELNVFQALKRSFLLCKSHWSKGFGTVIITFIIVGVISGIFSLIISGITGGVSNILVEGADAFTPIYIIVQVINQIISALLNIIPLSICGVLFFVLKELKDKISVQQSLDIWSEETLNNPDIKEDF